MAINIKIHTRIMSVPSAKRNGEAEFSTLNLNSLPETFTHRWQLKMSPSLKVVKDSYPCPLPLLDWKQGVCIVLKYLWCIKETNGRKTYLYWNTHARAHRHARAHTHTNTHTHTHKHHTYTHTHAHTHTHTHTRHVHTHARTHTHVCTHTHVLTHTYTLIHRWGGGRAYKQQTETEREKRRQRQRWPQESR